MILTLTIGKILSTIGTILLFVLILGTIVLVHEFGHFFFAKKCGIYVYEFSIGMGPKLWSKKDSKGETEYKICLIPIGGYCQLAGEGLDEDKKLPKNRLLQNKTVWQRFLVMFFGAGNNFILALIVLFFLGLVIGSPNTSSVIQGVVEGSPSYESGLLVGDKIVKVDDNKVKTLDDVQLYLALATEETKITVLRDNEIKEIMVTPLTGDEYNEKGYSFGINFTSERKYGVIAALKYTFTKSYALVRQICVTFKLLFNGTVSVSNLSGPIGIYTAVDTTATTSGSVGNTIANLFYLMALLSINVGFINLIPFPAFDGGRILFLVIEKIKGSPVKADTENLIHTIGFFILIALIIFVSFNDIIRLFK